MLFYGWYSFFSIVGLLFLAAAVLMFKAPPHR